MSDEKYFGEAVSAVKLTRCKLVHLSNELNYPMSATFHEEEIVTDASGSFVAKSGVGSFSEVLSVDNMNETFQIVNPLTKEPLGSTMTYQEFVVMVQSLYFHMAAKRDAATGVN